MFRRVLTATLMAASMAGLSVVVVPVQASADGESLPAVSVDDPVVQEPPPGSTATLVFTVTLDRPSADPVVVNYRTNPDYINDSVIGERVMPPGETSFQVPVTVHHNDSYTSFPVRLGLFSVEGATYGKFLGQGKVLNIEKAGSFACAAIGRRLYVRKTFLRPVTDLRYGELGATSPCQDRGTTTGRFTYTTPGGKGVKPVTITVTPADVSTRGEALPSPGFYGPFVGDGASARAVDYDVLISEPGGKSIEIEGLWGEVSTHCRALGAEPEMVTNGGVGGLVVNGKRSKDPSDVIHLNGGTVMLGVVERRSGTAEHPEGILTRTLLQLNFSYGYVQLGQIEVAYYDRPCET